MVTQNCTLDMATSPSDTKPAPECESPKEPSHRTKSPSKYDPHDYSNEHHPTTFCDSVFHFFKAIVGMGILALPYTFHSVGYAIAIPGAILVGIIYSHILHLLLQVEYALCTTLQVPRLTYAGVIGHTFQQGPKAFRGFAGAAKIMLYFHYVVNSSMYNAVYLVMIADNLKKIFDYYYDVDCNKKIILSVVILPLLLLGMVRRLKFLVPLSMLTTAFNFVNIFLIFYISSGQSAPVDDTKLINDPFEFPTFFGIVLGALSSTGIIIPLKNDMKTPKKFASLFGVLNIGLGGATALYVVFGFFGYLKFGANIQPNILSNLPSENNLTLLVLVLYSINISVSYTLFVYVIFDTIWSNLHENTLARMQHRVPVEYALRIFVNVLPYFIAIIVPNFKILVSISGVISVLVDIGLLPLLHMLMVWADKRDKNTCLRRLVFSKDFLLVVIAVSLFAGGVVNVIDKIKSFFT